MIYDPRVLPDSRFQKKRDTLASKYVSANNVCKNIFNSIIIVPRTDLFTSFYRVMWFLLATLKYSEERDRNIITK